MLDNEQIGKISERIRNKFNPARIVLFGSYVNGQATEESELDLLIVVPSNRSVEKINYAAIRKLLADFEASFDIIIKTEEEFKQWRHILNNIVFFADKYGKVLYEKQ